MKVLISACLLGQNVRYDGGNCKQDSQWLRELAGGGFLVPICPEMEAGMGAPRPPIEFLDGKIINQKGEDLTSLFNPVVEKIDRLIREHDIKMAILKEQSPSCGVKQVYDGSFSGAVVAGSGLIAGHLAAKMPVFSEEDLFLAEKTYLTLVKARP